MKNQRQNGFSLVELLIVVSVILVITGIAVPSLLKARMVANEASAVGSLRSIDIAEVNYSVSSNTGYSSDLGELGAAGLVDSTLANSGVTPKSGYRNTYSVTSVGGNNVGYTINADPMKRGTNGQLSFFTDQSGVIRANASRPANITDQAIGN